MIYLSQFTDLGQTICSDWFSVNDLVNLFVLIVLRLQFTKIVCNLFTERDLLRPIKQFFLSIC